MSFTAADIKEFRKKHNLTQEKLAEMIGVSWRTIQNYESGYTIPKSKNALLRVVFDEFNKSKSNEALNNKEWNEDLAHKIIEALYLHLDNLRKYENFVIWENSIRADERNKIAKEELKKRLDKLS